MENTALIDEYAPLSPQTPAWPFFFFLSPDAARAASPCSHRLYGSPKFTTTQRRQPVTRAASWWSRLVARRDRNHTAAALVVMLSMSHNT